MELESFIPTMAIVEAGRLWPFGMEGRKLLFTVLLDISNETVVVVVGSQVKRACSRSHSLWVTIRA